MDDDDEVEEVKNTGGVAVVETPPAVVSVKRSPLTSASLTCASVARIPSSAPRVTDDGTPTFTPQMIKFPFKDYGGVDHMFVVVILPSGFQDGRDLHLSQKIFGGTDYFLVIRLKWADTVDEDYGSGYLDYLRTKKLKRMIKKWMEKKHLEEQIRAKQEFEATWVLLRMALKQEMIRMRNSIGSDVLRSETWVKMDFPVEKLTSDSWDLIGDDSGVRLLVVDLEQATESEDCKQPSFERKVEMMDEPDLD